ncbi:sugar transferase [Deinococcus rhizophilus]|nr:sugar transferase [Deinococcus rhizophilus]
MRGRGWTVGLISAPTVPGELEGRAAEEGAQAFPVPMEREISPRADLRSVWHLYRALRQFRPTVLNVNTPKAALLGGLAGVAAGVPLRVYTLHGLRLETATGLKRRVLVAAERVAMACAHRVVCVSPSLQARVHELGLTAPHKTVVLGAGSVRGVRLPDPVTTAEETRALREALDLPEGTPVVGFVGRLARDKGLPELVSAYQALQLEVPEARLLLIGGEDAGDPVPPGVMETLGRLPGVLRTGLVPSATPYYPLMSVLALPTYREGFPAVALEAAAAGLPVVTTTATGARDAVQDGRTGWLVPVGDDSALARALREALTHPGRAQAYGEAGQAWVRDAFDPVRVQEGWVAYCETLLDWRRASTLHPWKRGMDLALSGLALTALGLPMLGLALAVRRRLGSPVLFRQVRPGLQGQPFTMYKFRSMTDERGPNGELLPDRVRLTPFGRFLRSTSLDELPELFNVLKGDMSLVGPRPLLTRYTPFFTPEEAQRLDVRPGITGWAQVNGRNTASWDDRLAMDVWYVRHLGLWLDLKIVWSTVRKVLGRTGVVDVPNEAMLDLDAERGVRV